MSKHKNNGVESSLERYLKEINKIPLLTREEERYYAKRMQEGIQEAKDMIIKSNLRFVVTVAKRYQGKGLSLSDLINEGNLGLIKATEKFDYEKGYHFLSYAVWWIRQSILKAVGQNSRSIRLPLSISNDLGTIENIRTKLEQKLNYTPPIELIAQEMGKSVDYINMILRASKEPLSLDISANDSDIPLVDYIIDSRQEDIPEYEMLKRSVDNALEILTKREADIIKKRFGLNGNMPMHLKELGKEYQLSRERIRQIEKKALKKIRRNRLAKTLKVYLD